MLLPNEYQEVEYIENNGTAYILTGLSIKDGYRNKMKVRFLSTAAADTYPGISGGYLGPDSGLPGGHGRFYLIGLQTNGSLNYGYLANYGDIGSGLTTGTDYEIDYSWISGNAFVKLNGNTLQSSSTTYSTSLQGQAPVGGAAHMDQSEGNQYWANPGIRIYYSKFYNTSGTLVRDFVPCYRKSDDVVGLYDLVNDVFYTNQGTGVFAKGPDFKGGKISKGYLRVREPNIPAEYQEVEYIENSGTQWIDTGFYPDSNTMVQMKYVYMQFSGGQLFGNGLGESDGFRYFRASNYTYLDYGSGNGYNRIQGTYVTSTTDIYETEFGNRYVKDIPTNTVKFSSSAVSFSRKSYTARIFIENGSDLMKLYYCKVYDNGTLVRDFVPCYRKSDNVIGMYDRVGGQFYTNQGSGTFTKGNDVEPTYIFVEKQFYPGGGGGGGFVFEYDFTTKTKAEAIADGWHGEGGGDWSVSSAGAYFSRAATDRSYVVSYPITLPSTVNTMYLKSRFRGDVYSWAGTYSTTIKQTYTCGSGNVYPNDDYIQSCSASYNSNSGYQWCGTGCEPVTQSGVGSSNSIGSDWIDVESFYNLNAMTGWGKITRVSDGVELWAQSFSLNDLSRITSKLGQDVYVCLFFRNGTYDNKWCKNVRVEIT